MPIDEPRRPASSTDRAKAQLEKDVEALEATLNAERFCVAVLIVVVFDAFMFREYKTWASPLALAAIEFAGLFVLARRLGVDEIVGLVYELVRSWGKSRDSDPK